MELKIALIGNEKSIHIVKFANTLSDKGHKVTLFSLAMHSDGGSAINGAVERYYLKGNSTMSYFLAALELKRALSKGTYDVVNAHYASGYGTLARLAKAKPLVLNVWGSDVYDFPYQGKLKRKLIIKNLLYADRLASTSFVMRDQVLRLLNDYNKEITIVPFGIDIEKFYYVDRNSSIIPQNVSTLNDEPPTKPVANITREDLTQIPNWDRQSIEPNFDKNPDVVTINIGIVKTLRPIYGINYLIEAFKLLKDSLPDIYLELHIFGKGEQLSELQSLCNDLQISEFVHFGGFVHNNNIPDILASMDIFAVASINESFGVAVVEAMASGLPVVATAVDGFKEVVEDDKTGFLVPPKDPEKMAAALKLLVENPSLRLEMGKNGRRRVEDLYDIDKNVDQLIEAFKSVANSEKFR